MRLLLLHAMSAIKNGLKNKKTSVDVIGSNSVISVLQVLKEEGYIMDVKKSTNRDDSSVNLISVALRYHNRMPVIKELKVFEKGVFVKKMSKIPRNFSITILSTSRGIMSHMKAVELKIGGQKLLEVF